MLSRPGPLRVALLTSRRAPGLERLIARSRRPGAAWRLVGAVVSDPDGASIGPLREAGVPAAVHDPREFCRRRGAAVSDPAARRAYDRALVGGLEPFRPDLLVLSGWLWILGRRVLEAYPDRIVNVHDADLTIRGLDGKPRYRGLRSTRDAVAAGERETRSSVHLVTEEVDGGPLLVRSWGFPVHALVDDARRWGAGDVVSAYAYAQREWMMRASWGALLERALDRLTAGDVRIVGGRAHVAGWTGPEELDPDAAAGPVSGVGLAAVAGGRP